MFNVFFLYHKMSTANLKENKSLLNFCWFTSVTMVFDDYFYFRSSILITKLCIRYNIIFLLFLLFTWILMFSSFLSNLFSFQAFNIEYNISFCFYYAKSQKNDDGIQYIYYRLRAIRMLSLLGNINWMIAMFNITFNVNIYIFTKCSLNSLTETR